ncbi:MAG: tetratricopeptide repeat protein [Deferribacterales bacterium]
MNEASVLRYKRDIEYFSKKLEEDPTSRLFMPLAFAYLKLGKYDEAITICSKGLDNHPDYHAAKVVLANAFLEKGMVEEAKNLLYDVIEKMPENYRANKMLGDILRSEGDIVTASVYYRSALITSPEDFELKVLLDELTQNFNVRPPDLTQDLKNLDDLLKQADNVSPDTDIQSLKNELGDTSLTLTEEDYLNQTTPDDQFTEKHEIVVEIPDEILGTGIENLERSIPENRTEEITSEKDEDLTIEMGNIDISLDEILSEKTEDKSVTSSFDSLSDNLLNDIESQPNSDLDKNNTPSETDELFKELDINSLETTEQNEEVSNQFAYIEKELDISLNNQDTDLLSIEDKPDNSEIIPENQRIIDELEQWLNNIRKMKEKKNA